MAVAVRRRAEPADTPLFEWPRQRSVILIEAERAAILARVARLKPRSHARIVAEDRLRALTHHALAVETAGLDIALLPQRDPQSAP